MRVREQIQDVVMSFAEQYKQLLNDQATFNDAVTRSLYQLEDSVIGLPSEEVTALRAYYRTIAEPFLKEGFLQEYCRKKPFGYAGDYQAIDYILTNYISDDSPARVWDQFFQTQAAAKAVRNRKDYLTATILALQRSTSSDLAVLDLGSGPCRDVAEVLDQSPLDHSILIDCLDIDRTALNFGERLLGPYQDRYDIHFHCCNMLRFRPARKYDLVWCGGVFDYFGDKTARAMVDRMVQWTKPGGKITVGNFAPPNPTRSYMEWVVDWLLIHRTEQDFERLVASVPNIASVAFKREPEKVILFCEITKQDS
jgi:extracellular factor (EF) 3-hydroxypalmitic acid methyl ester biosynthesis protein